jgi:hypothetical protein
MTANPVPLPHGKLGQTMVPPARADEFRSFLRGYVHARTHTFRVGFESEDAWNAVHMAGKLWDMIEGKVGAATTAYQEIDLKERIAAQKAIAQQMASQWVRPAPPPLPLPPLPLPPSVLPPQFKASPIDDIAEALKYGDTSTAKKILQAIGLKGKRP